VEVMQLIRYTAMVSTNFSTLLYAYIPPRIRLNVSLNLTKNNSAGLSSDGQ
jgi:hypothetical protein